MKSLRRGNGKPEAVEGSNDRKDNNRHTKANNKTHDIPTVLFFWRTFCPLAHESNRNQNGTLCHSEQ